MQNTKLTIEAEFEKTAREGDQPFIHVQIRFNATNATRSFRFPVVGRQFPDEALAFAVATAPLVALAKAQEDINNAPMDWAEVGKLSEERRNIMHEIQRHFDQPTRRALDYAGMKQRIIEIDRVLSVFMFFHPNGPNEDFLSPVNTCSQAQPMQEPKPGTVGAMIFGAMSPDTAGSADKEAPKQNLDASLRDPRTQGTKS